LYNKAYILVELNDLGGQVANDLFEDYDYDNLVFTESNGRNGKTITFGGVKSDKGVRTTKPVKAQGCSMLKLLIEQQQLLINDFATINELSKFSKKGSSYEAENGEHDDMVMGLVLFAWMSYQPTFAELNDINTMHRLRYEGSEWEAITPFGFIDDGRDDEIEVVGNISFQRNDSWILDYD